MTQQAFTSDNGFNTLGNITAGNIITGTGTTGNITDAEVTQNFNYYRTRFGL